MSKVVKFLADPLDLFGKRAKAKAKKKEKKRERRDERKERRRDRVLSDRAFRESSSLLGGRSESTQTGSLLGG